MFLSVEVVEAIGITVLLYLLWRALAFRGRWLEHFRMFGKGYTLLFSVPEWRYWEKIIITITQILW